MTTMRVVGECFFWYRLTRVFPDKFHRAVKWLCVCVFFFSLTASATSLFHHHGSFDNPHVTCAISIIIFFTCSQCSFTSRYFQSASSALSLTTLWYSSCLFLRKLPYMHSWFKLLMPSFFALNHMSITKNLCFGTYSSFGMTLTLRIFALTSCRRTSCIYYQLGFLLHKQSVAND